MKKTGSFKWTINRYGIFFLMLTPALVLLFVFNYLPLTGLLIAFKDYNLRDGIKGFFVGNWIGFEHFWYLRDAYFWRTVRNTFSITIYRMFVCFPLPIIMAVMLCELRSLKYRRVMQSLSYLPNFISWVIAAYMINSILALDTGIINVILIKLGLDQVYFMGSNKWFSTIVVVSAAWKGTGWGTIIYLAALSNISPELQEASVVDGASRFKRIWHVDLPCIRPTIVIVLILSMPQLINAGFEQIMPLQNPANMGASDILDIYVVRLGILQTKYSLSTAVSMVISLMNLSLVLLTNYVSRLLGEDGLF